MSPKRSTIAGAMAAAAVLSAAAPATTFADTQPTSSTPSAAQLADLTPSELALFSSSAPKAIVMDPTTGEILSVAPAAASPAISHHAVCNPGDGCYKTNNSSDTDQGFYAGAGTAHGTWYERSGYSAGKWTVSACWSGGCGITISPGSSVSLTSDVTGTSFTIH